MSDLWVQGVHDSSASCREPLIPEAVSLSGVAGLPDAPRALDVSVLFDPIRWLRWRREVHRLGPYAAPYDGRSVELRIDVWRVGFLALVVLVIVVLVARA